MGLGWVGQVGDGAHNLGDDALAFGPFQLLRAEKILLERGTALRVGGRAFELLAALVERPGEVVSKQELMAIAWPDTFVDEGNLRVQFANLRKQLGCGRDGARYIVNVSGRGYSFVAPVSRGAAPPPQARLSEGSSLPVNVTRLVGRDEVVETLVEQFVRRRFVTIVGPGGMGKSTVAVAVAERLANIRRYGAHFIDLTALDAGATAVSAVATALGVSALTDDPIGSLITHLAERSMLLVFDNCEHVLDALAPLISRIVREAVGVDLLMTSREPLQVETEWVHRLASLETPPPGPLTAVQALSYPAVQLFVERAMSSLESFALDDEQAMSVANICRRLDGSPLAIELIAARTDLFGIAGLEVALDDQLLVLSGGRRAPASRQQSLRGALDWSYGLLSPAEQLILRRLSVFRAAFAMESAVAISAPAGLSPDQVQEGVVSLATKSLVVADASGATIRYRLLHVTRVYALEKLKRAGEADSVLRLHAEHYRAMFVQAEARWGTFSRADWLAEYGYSIDDVRAALDWAFSPIGDLQIGAFLTAAALPFGYQMNLIDEFRMRAKIALSALAQMDPPQPVSELRINVVLGWIGMNTDLDPVATRAAFARAYELAEALDDDAARIEPLLGLAIFHLEMGQYDRAVHYTDQMKAHAARTDKPLAMLLADRAAAQSHHWLGDHARGRDYAERVIRHPALAVPLAYSQASVDRRISMRVVLARTLWLEGRADQARDVVNDCMELAYADSPFAISQALTLAACPLALWRGDDAEAEHHIDKLLDYTTRFSLTRWNHFGLGFRDVLRRRRGLEASYRHDLKLGGPRAFSVMQHELLITTDQGLIDGPMTDRATQGAPGWAAAEMLRATGELWLREQGETATPTAQINFLRAIKIAREQRALAWELRAATSLARLWRFDRSAEGRALLEEVLGRFTEGHDTADVVAAQELLVALSGTLPALSTLSPFTRH